MGGVIRAGATPPDGGRHNYPAPVVGAPGRLRVVVIDDRSLRRNGPVRLLGVMATGGDGSRARRAVIDCQVGEGLVPARDQAASSSGRTLAERERDVVAEVGTGPSDAARVGRLVRSERPAEQHVDERSQEPDLVWRAGQGG